MREESASGTREGGSEKHLVIDERVMENGGDRDDLPKPCAECRTRPARAACRCGEVGFCCADCHVKAWTSWHRLRCTDECASYAPLSRVEWKTLRSAFDPRSRGTDDLLRYANTGRPIVRFGWYAHPGYGSVRTAGSFYMPIVRYEESPFSVLASEKAERGTAFAYEPNSSTWLDVGRAAFFPSVVAAFFALRRHLRPEDVSPEDIELLTDDVAPYRGTLAWRVNGGVRARCDDSGVRSAIAEFGRRFYGWFPRSFRRGLVPTFDVSVPDAAGRARVSFSAGDIGPVPGRVTPLMPSVGASIDGAYPDDSVDHLRRMVCTAARKADLDTVVITFDRSGFDGRRVATIALSVTRSPISSLARCFSSIDAETMVATTKHLSWCDRLNRPTPSRSGTCGIDPALATVWFPDDGLYYGNSGTSVVPYFDSESGFFEGIDIVDRPAEYLAWTPSRMPS